MPCRSLSGSNSWKRRCVTRDIHRAGDFVLFTETFVGRKNGGRQKRREGKLIAIVNMYSLIITKN